MRWRISLITALALFVAVSCDQTTTAPDASETDTIALFGLEDSKSPVWHSEQIVDHTWDVCGRILDFSGRMFVRIRRFADAGGNEHWTWKYNHHVTALDPTTGLKWTWNDNDFGQSNWGENHDEYTARRWYATFVSQGGAPNFKIIVSERLVQPHGWGVGEPSVEWYFEEWPTCE